VVRALAFRAVKGGATDLKVRGTKYATGARRNFFLTPPHSWLSGGTNNLTQYCKVYVVVFANFEESCLLVARFARNTMSAGFSCPPPVPRTFKKWGGYVPPSSYGGAALD
jgi:hypothetical protein